MYGGAIYHETLNITLITQFNEEIIGSATIGYKIEDCPKYYGSEFYNDHNTFNLQIRVYPWLLCRNHIQCKNHISRITPLLSRIQQHGSESMKQVWIGLASKSQ